MSYGTLLLCFVIVCGAVVEEYRELCGGVVVDVREFGAVGDGRTLDTPAFQAAIASLSPAGGCVGAFSGQYLIAQVDLASRTFLYVHGDAVLLGSVDEAHYRWNDSYPWTINWAVVRGVGIAQAGLIGNGVLSGQALKMVEGYDPAQDQFIPQRWTGPPHFCSGECRPRAVVFVNSSSILLHGLTILDSPDWTTHFLGSRSILLDSLRIHGDPRWPNNDGIDLDSSQDILITNSIISTGDDAICLKTTSGYGILRNVTVLHSTVSSRSCALKFGSSTPEDLREVHFENLTIGVSHRGIGFQVRDAGSVYDVVFRSISVVLTRMYPQAWWGAGEFLWITASERAPGEPCGSVFNILLENITAFSENGALLSSFHGNKPYIHNITLRNIHLTLAKYSNDSQPSHDYRPTYPPDTLDVPISGFYFEYCSDVLVSDCSVTFAANRTNPGGCFTIGEEAVRIHYEKTMCKLPNDNLTS